ncbi:hypothetical protein B0J13DRAFT_105254 [Dactylonectria estremocensis]|uniref:Lysine-specific metallo-endopeptidase domain-containing protein n=1 Tax=Dactylonectria estremocensis TaxID=1079267 RepID=A0A9P9IUG0_9HYPO|nr:hypothetical protein B0J13DRAFT_105254 [Dactylonectria estremocensis]
MMMSTTSSFPFLARLAQFAAVFGLLGPLVQAVEVTDVFTVKTGAGGGSCDTYMGQVNDWFKDSQAIASAPITVADNAVRDVLDHSLLVDMEYLGTYFRIPPPDNEPDSHSRQVLANAQRAKQLMQGEISLETGKPWLYCGDGWAVELEWTAEVRADRQIREENQEIYTRGTQLEGIFFGYYTLFYTTRVDANGQTIDPKKPPYKPWWVEDLKQYIFAPSVTGGSPCVSGKNLGTTMFQTAPWSVTLCFDNDGLGRPQLLSNMAPITGVNQLVPDRRSVSITFYHEILHLAIGPGSADFAYEFVEIVGWTPSYLTGEQITWDQSILNPESYTLFALATYLGEQYPDYVFWNGWSKSKSA